MSDQQGTSGFDLSKIEEIAHARVTRRGVLQGAAALGALAALGPLAAACGSSSGGGTSASPSSSSAGGLKKGGEIRAAVGGGSAKDTLEATTATSETQVDYQWQLYDSLMAWDPAGQLMMTLAESYEPNSDATQHTVRLKSGLTFHDGKPVTADDVVFSFQRILDPKTGAIGKDMLTGLKPSGLEKIDDLTVRFSLEKPNVIFEEALAYFDNAIVPVGYDPSTISGAIGTGPWKVVSYAPGQQIEFVANPDYWGEGPYADKLTITEFADPTAKLNALLDGSVDQVSLIDATQAATMESTPGMQLVKAKTGGWEPFTMRIDAKPFDDVRVRQAFRLIFDRQQMIDQAKGGYAWVGNDMYAPFDPGYPKDLPQRAQDLEQAKALLKQAGYDNDLRVDLTTSTAVGSTGPLAAQVFAQQAKGAGVTVKVNNVDPSVFYGDNYLSWAFAQDFWGTHNYLSQASLGTTPGAPYNETHWKDAEWQKIIDEAFRTVDETARNELIAQASAIEFDRGGLIIWAYNVLIDAHSDKLQGMVEDTRGANGASRCRYNLMYFA